MKRLSLLLLLLLAPLHAAELGKPAGPLGVSLPAAPLAISAGPVIPGVQTPSIAPGLPSAPLSAGLPPAAPALPVAQAAAPAASQGPSAAPSEAHHVPTALEQVRAIRANLETQLRGMEAVLGGGDPVLDQVRAEADHSLSRIEDHIAHGRLHPSLGIRSSHAAPEVVTPRTPRVGVYPVAADPFQWAHLLIGLRAMAEFELDKVIYVLAGDDPRKPNMTPVLHRHPMGKAVLDAFSPLFGYSDIAVGTTLDGETNIFRMLALNPGQDVHAFYLVGGDHYKLKDKNGNDDTIPKIEKKQADASLGHQPDRHRVSVAFIARGDEGETIPTPLDVRMLPAVTFEASSTLVRQGKLALMPFAAYQWVLDNLPGHYGIGSVNTPQ